MLMMRIPGYCSNSIPITRLVYKRRLPHNKIVFRSTETDITRYYQQVKFRYTYNHGLPGKCRALYSITTERKY